MHGISVATNRGAGGRIPLAVGSRRDRRHADVELRGHRARTRFSAARGPAPDADYRRGPKEDLGDLPKTFDAAFPLWCQYFGLDAAKLADWHVTAYLMKSREHFEQAGYWDAGLPPFLNGFSAGAEILALRSKKFLLPQSFAAA